MKLSELEFFLDWPVSIEVRDLRKYIILNLMNKGKVIRWSIVDIQSSRDALNTKLCIHAVLAV